MRQAIQLTCVLTLTLVMSAPAEASVASKTVQEAIEFAARKFGKEVAEEGVEKLTQRVGRLALQHGDDVVSAAVRKVGPRAARVAVAAGEHGSPALRVLAKYGDDAVLLASRPSALRLVAQHGDDAAAALLRHGTVGEKVVEQFAKEGAEALVKVTPQNGRRLAMLAAEGQLKPEMLTVIRQYGDEACDFVWRNKGALATGAALATFVASPEPFLKGAQQLTSTVAEAAVKPLAEVPKVIAAEAAKNTDWTLLSILAGSVAGLTVVVWFRRGRSVARLSQRWISSGEDDRPIRDS